MVSNFWPPRYVYTDLNIFTIYKFLWTLKAIICPLKCLMLFRNNTAYSHGNHENLVTPATKRPLVSPNAFAKDSRQRKKSLFFLRQHTLLWLLCHYLRVFQTEKNTGSEKKSFNSRNILCCEERESTRNHGFTQRHKFPVPKVRREIAFVFTLTVVPLLTSVNMNNFGSTLDSCTPIIGRITRHAANGLNCGEILTRCN